MGRDKGRGEGSADPQVVGLVRGRAQAAGAVAQPRGAPLQRGEDGGQRGVGEGGPALRAAPPPVKAGRTQAALSTCDGCALTSQITQ